MTKLAEGSAGRVIQATTRVEVNARLIGPPLPAYLMRATILTIVTRWRRALAEPWIAIKYQFCPNGANPVTDGWIPGEWETLHGTRVGICRIASEDAANALKHLEHLP